MSLDALVGGRVAATPIPTCVQAVSAFLRGGTLIPPLLYLQLLFVRAQTLPLRQEILESKGHLACLQLMTWSSRFYVAEEEAAKAAPEPWVLELQIQAMQLLDALTIESPGCTDRTYTLRPYHSIGGAAIHKTLAELAAVDGVEVTLHIFRQSLARQHYTLPFCFRLLGRFLNYGTRQARQLIADTEVISQFTTFYVPPKKPCPLSATVEYEATAFTQLLLQWLSRRKAAPRVDEAAISSDRLASETPYPKPARRRGERYDDDEEEEDEEGGGDGWDEPPTPIAGGTGRRSASAVRGRSAGGVVGSTILMPLRGHSSTASRSPSPREDGRGGSGAPSRASRAPTGGSSRPYSSSDRAEQYSYGGGSNSNSRGGSRSHSAARGSAAARR